MVLAEMFRSNLYRLCDLFVSSGGLRNHLGGGGVNLIGYCYVVCSLCIIMFIREHVKVELIDL